MTGLVPLEYLAMRYNMNKQHPSPSREKESGHLIKRAETDDEDISAS
jgi:hypothetical protein